jgi:hypothetical protein
MCIEHATAVGNVAEAAFPLIARVIASIPAARMLMHESGTRDATRHRMLRMKDTNKLLKNILRALPAISAIPFLAPKKTSILPFVLGAVGVAVVGGIAAVMVFSPRTRYRALDIAKEGYGKVRGQLDELGISEKLGIAGEHAQQQPQANGLVNESGGGYSSAI